MTDEPKLIAWEEREAVNCMATAAGISNRPLGAAAYCLMIHQRMPLVGMMTAELCGFLAARLMMNACSFDLFVGQGVTKGEHEARALAMFEETLANDKALAVSTYAGAKALAERPAGTVRQ